jgi:hypothetical protein
MIAAGGYEEIAAALIARGTEIDATCGRGINPPATRELSCPFRRQPVIACTSQRLRPGK